MLCLCNNIKAKNNERILSMKKDKEKEFAEHMPVPVTSAEGTVEEAPAPKKRGGRKKKTDEKAAAKPVKKAPVRRARKKAVVPNFVIQDSDGNGVTYDVILEKVQAAADGIAVKTLDIYVKADEGKAYYVVNGETDGDVDLF